MVVYVGKNPLVTENWHGLRLSKPPAVSDNSTEGVIDKSYHLGQINDIHIQGEQMKTSQPSFDGTLIKFFITTVVASLSLFAQSLASAQQNYVTTPEELSLREIRMGMSPQMIKDLFGHKCSDPHSLAGTTGKLPRHHNTTGTEGVDFALLGDTGMSCDRIEILDRVTRRFYLFFSNDKLEYVWISHFQNGLGRTTHQTHPPAYFEALGEKYGVKPIYTTVRKNVLGEAIVIAPIMGKNNDLFVMSGPARLDDKGNYIDYPDTVLKFHTIDFYEKLNMRIEAQNKEREAIEQKKEEQNRKKL